MTAATGTDFTYRGRDLHFELLPDCSVSRHLQTNRVFYELPFLEALEASLPSTKVVFDVGAHIGNHTIFFAKILGWRVVAFEPNPDAFRKLMANVEANEVGDLVTCHQVAITDAPGVVSLARTEPSDAGTVAVLDRDMRTGRFIEAQANVLDAYQHLVGDGPLLIKIDVEGHERKVLEGGSNLLTRIAPNVTTEVQSISEFESLAEILGASHRPSGVFNPTPTILWRPRSDMDAPSADFDVIRYAIRAQISYNESHRRSLRARRSVDTVTSILLEENGHRPTEAEKAGLVRLRDQLAAAGEIQELAGKRLLMVVVGATQVPAAALSAVTRAVDIVEVGEHEPRSILMRRYVGGRSVDERVISGPGGADLLAAAQIALFVESGDQGYGPVSAAAVIGGESAPDIADVAIDLLGVPYIHIAVDPIYLPRRLPRIIGASASFVSSPDRLEDWNNRQIVPASTLDPEDPMSLVGGISQALAKRRHAGRAADGKRHRLLLVSYYSPPAKTVAIQRLSYWKDNLESIGESMGISLSVDWLSATNQTRSEEGFVYVADRGPFELPQSEWDKWRSLQDLDLDVIAATWSHYVREAVDRMDEPYDAVLISGNPFYYFDLASSFKARWGSRVVLDFRDPWARQERFQYSIEQRAKLIELEEELVARADAVISVNSECLKAIAPHTSVPKYVVANGFDETIVDAVPEPHRDAHGPIQLVYAGTVYATLPLDNLLAALNPERHRLIHFGRDYSRSQSAKTHPLARSAGMVDYEALISDLKASDAGIVMTTGEPTMSTTKIFDYVACGLDLIIITKGRPRTGLLHEMTAELDGVYWVKDDLEDLERFFSDYRPERRHRRDRLRFSRSEQAKRLLQVLYQEDELVAGAMGAS